MVGCHNYYVNVSLSVMVEKVPCEECICRPICKYKSLTFLIVKCSLVYNYLTEPNLRSEQYTRVHRTNYILYKFKAGEKQDDRKSIIPFSHN